MTLRAAVLLLALLAPSDKMLSIVISKVYSLFLKSIVTYWKNLISHTGNVHDWDIVAIERDDFERAVILP